MDYLQYKSSEVVVRDELLGFKPCYKWITFNIGKVL